MNIGYARVSTIIKDLVEIVSDLEKSIGFSSITGLIDTTSAGGKLIVHFWVSCLSWCII